MLEIFTTIADKLTNLMALDTSTAMGKAIHFFIEDSFKIFVLMYLLIFFISLFRANLSVNKVRDYLQGKNRWTGYVLATILGAITPFCSCSSIPIFMGFLAAGVPFGITVSFLVSSPLISEIAAIMLLSMGAEGVKIDIVYILSGGIISILAGYSADKFGVEKYLIYKPNMTVSIGSCSCLKEKVKAIIVYANDFALNIIKSIAPYVFIGLAIGAAMHGYVPQEFFTTYLGAQNIWAVPLAVITGVPIYANHASVVPIVQVLLLKGVPVGTALVLLMSCTAISLPEMIMLKKVFSGKLLGLFVAYLILAFLITGYVINAIN